MSRLTLHRPGDATNSLSNFPVCVSQTSTLFQNTDAHISCDTELDREYEQYSTRMNNAFKDRNTTTSFAQQIQIAQQKKVDLIALTGD